MIDEMNPLQLRVARAIDDILARVGVGFVDQHTSAEFSRSVIEAMRIPTEAMLAATEGNGPLLDWQAMIDAALK